MNVIAIAEYGNDFPTAVVKAHDKLDENFVTQVRHLPSWEKVEDDEMLAAQTFVAWIRQKHGYAGKSLAECLENEQYAWSGILTVQEV